MLRKNIPNGITALNLLLGALAIVLLLNREYSSACWLIAAAGLADFLDGLAARALKVKSALGGQLDSLADMVSFGLVPGIIYYQLLGDAYGVEGFQWLAVPAFLVTISSAFRLAIFNLDDRQAFGFIGLPTPANTLLALGVLLSIQENSLGWGASLGSPFFLYPFILVSSWLLVANIPLFSLKFKSFGWEGNEIRIIFVLSSAILLLLLREFGLVAVIALYLLLSLLFKQKDFHEISGRN